MMSYTGTLVRERDFALIRSDRRLRCCSRSFRAQGSTCPIPVGEVDKSQTEETVFDFRVYFFLQ